MADQSARSRTQPSRLQRRAPASIQVTNPVNNWNVAIPLLSPLVTSPDVKRNCTDINEEQCRRVVVVNSEDKTVTEPEKVSAPAVYKKWQHPAAPFYYEPAPVLLQSICSGVVDRS